MVVHMRWGEREKKVETSRYIHIYVYYNIYYVLHKVDLDISYLSRLIYIIYSRLRSIENYIYPNADAPCYRCMQN